MPFRPIIMMDIWEFFTPKERAAMAACLPSGSVGALALTRLSTVKEAVLTQSGRGQTIFLRLNKISPLWEVSNETWSA